MYPNITAPPIEASLYPPITVRGFGGCYEDYAEMFPASIRARVATVAASLAMEAGIDQPAERLLLCGFSGDYDDVSMAGVDARKLAVHSSVPDGGGFEDEETFWGFDGDDSNLPNIVERQRQELRNEKARIGEELRQAFESGTLTDSARLTAAAAINDLNQRISDLGQAKLADQLPVYYATPLSGLQSPDAEDSPLAYLGDPEPDSPGVLAIFDQTSLQEAGIRIEEKSEAQTRIITTGAELMRHCVAIVHIHFTEPEA